MSTKLIDVLDDTWTSLFAFRIMATPNQFNVKCESKSFVTVFLVPFWPKEELLNYNTLLKDKCLGRDEAK